MHMVASITIRLTQAQSRILAAMHMVSSTMIRLQQALISPPSSLSAALHQAGGEGEEPQAERPAGRARLQPGRHLRQVGVARCGAQQAARGVQLPVHLHPLGAHAGGEVGRRFPIRLFASGTDV